MVSNCMTLTKMYSSFLALSPFVVRLKHLVSVIYNSIRNLNLYNTKLTTEVRLQKLYTRIYILLFTSSLGILLFYNAIVERSVTQTYPSPSIADYEHLLNLYPDNVNCPCTYLAIPYDNFVTDLRVGVFHQACSTNVISNILLAGKDDFIG